MKVLQLELKQVRAPALDPVLARRMLLTLLIAAMITLTLFFSHLASKRQIANADAQLRGAWSTRTVAATPDASLPLNQFAASWGANNAAAGELTTLRWRAPDRAALRTSLLALDATGVKAQRINVAAKDGAFEVTAEVSK